MANLAIKGHATRGNEVIEILEMLGGSNAFGHIGNNKHAIYYINETYKNFITCSETKKVCDCTIFTLEEFLEKFPYKVGDKILYKTYGIYLRIKTMLWNVEKEQVFYRLESNKLFVATADELKFCKEETMEADEQLNKDLKRLIRKAKSYDKLVSKGFVNIERVCEWLDVNFPTIDSTGSWYKEGFIKQFKKAMEE